MLSEDLLFRAPTGWWVFVPKVTIMFFLVCSLARSTCNDDDDDDGGGVG
jgi:hypothetical protein